MSGVAILFVWWAEKLPQKTWWAKLTLIKTNNRTSLILIIPLSAIITSNPMKCNSSPYNCVLFYQVLQNFQYC